MEKVKQQQKDRVFVCVQLLLEQSETPKKINLNVEGETTKLRRRIANP